MPKRKSNDEPIRQPSVSPRDYRIEAGLDLQTAAYISGVSAESIEQWERGQGLPNILEVRKLSIAYKASEAGFITSYIGRALNSDEIGQVKPRREAWLKELRVSRAKGSISADIKAAEAKRKEEEEKARLEEERKRKEEEEKRNVAERAEQIKQVYLDNPHLTADEIAAKIKELGW